MPAIATDRLGRILALLMLVLTGCAGQLFAASCDQPRVSFQAGQLTISSQGCSLQQVLTAVGRQTGIETQVPASASAVPVFANLGPGDPRQVVSALLDGTSFNWSLATEGNVSRRLVAVVLTERSAPLEPAKLSAAAQAAATLAANGKPPASQALLVNKQERANATEAAFQDQPPDQPKRRVEIDEATLSKLPPLPPGVPSSMWQLFPDIVANIVDNGGVVQGGPNGQPGPTASSPTASASDPAFAPKGCQNCPVPPGVDPRMRGLYPWDLMQQIQMPVRPSNVVQPPPPPWAPRPR